MQVLNIIEFTGRDGYTQGDYNDIDNQIDSCIKEDLISLGIKANFDKHNWFITFKNKRDLNLFKLSGFIELVHDMSSDDEKVYAYIKYL